MPKKTRRLVTYEATPSLKLMFKRFNDHQKKELREICNRPGFLEGVEEVSISFQSGIRLKRKLSRLKDRKAYLDIMMNRVRSLRKALEDKPDELATRTYAMDLLPHQDWEFLKNLCQKLEDLEDKITSGFNIQERRAQTLTPQFYRDEMVDRLQELFESYELPVSDYDDGPFCRCLDIVLATADEATEEPRNPLRAAKKTIQLKTPRNTRMR